MQCMPIHNSSCDIVIFSFRQVEKLQKHLYPDIHGAVVKQEFFGKFGRNAFNCTCEMWYWSEFVKVRVRLIAGLID